jgi:hypothetical protein
VELFRIAPLKPNVDRDGRSVSIGVVDFDGLYDENHKLLMSMYDWFIQGYIDAKGLTAADWTSDSIVLDYLDSIASSTRGYVKDSAKPSGNKFWRATERSLPSEPP